MTNDELRLHAGELTASEIRAIRAVEKLIYAEGFAAAKEAAAKTLVSLDRALVRCSTVAGEHIRGLSPEQDAPEEQL